MSGDSSGRRTGSTPAKTQGAGKRGGKRATSWKPGQSGNPAGAPKRGQSWRELISELGDYDGPAAAERAGFLAVQFRKMTPGVTLKELVVLRVFAALIDDPQPGLLNAFMERVEGKVSDELKLSGNSAAPLTFQVVYGPRRIVAGAAPEASGNVRQPEAAQAGMRGSAGGENNAPGDAGDTESAGGSESA